MKKAPSSTRSLWSGRISIGLVNVPVKLYTMIRDKSFSFRFLRKDDACPLKYQRVCTLDDHVVEWDDVVRGYEVRKGEFVIFDNEELKALRPESSRKIQVDKFVHALSIDPIYHDRSYILVPDQSEDAYSLLHATLKKKSMAAVGTFTLRNKEHPVLIHAYRGALILTTLLYADEVVDPLDMDALQTLGEPSETELALAEKIIDNLSGEFHVEDYNDGFKAKVEQAIQQKIQGETIIVEEPKSEDVKELMEALQETLKRLQTT